MNIDECETMPCRNEAKCVDFVNGYKCECAPGFGGKNCEIDVNECSSQPCANNATCIDLVNKLVTFRIEIFSHVAQFELEKFIFCAFMGSNVFAYETEVQIYLP